MDGASSTVDNSKKEKGLGESQDRDPFSHDVVFLINAHKGFTHRLALAASANNEPTASVSVSPNENAKEASVKVFVDGPYGITPDLTLCDTVVLIAGRFHLNFFGWSLDLSSATGGSGISYILPVFLDLVE